MQTAGLDPTRIGDPLEGKRCAPSERDRDACRSRRSVRGVVPSGGVGVSPGGVGVFPGGSSRAWAVRARATTPACTSIRVFI